MDILFKEYADKINEVLGKEVVRIIIKEGFPPGLVVGKAPVLIMSSEELRMALESMLLLVKESKSVSLESAL